MEQYLSPNSDGAGMSLPLSSLRLLVPPLRVMSAFMYQTLQQNSFMHYDKLDKFVAMVTELAPQLLSHREKIQLLLGLRAKFLLELCRGSTDGPTVQHYLDRMRSCCVSQSLSEMKHSDIEGSMSNFENTIYALLKDPVEKAYFFQEIYPVEYGSQFDTEVKHLMCKLISRLEQWMSVPDREQVASWLTAVPGFFEKCLEFGTMDLKCLLQYSPCHKHWSPVTPTCLKEDSNSILNTLATPLPAIKVVVATEPVAYHIAPGATCMGILDPGSLGDVVGETIIVTEYTEVELRTSDEGGTVPVEEMQTDDILPLVKEEMEVKTETSDAEEVESSVLVEHHQSAHVSEEVVTVLDWPMNLAQSVTPEMKDACAVTVVEEDAGTSQQAPGGQEVDADPGQHEQHAFLPCELVPGRVVLEQVSVAPQGAGTRDVRDVDVEDNSAPCTGESNDSQVGSTDKADKSSGDNIAPMKVDQPQNGKAASTGSPPEEGASVPQQECPGSSSVGQPCAAVTDPPHQEVHEVTEVTPQTVTPRRGRGRPRKSEQKSAKTPTSTPTGNPVVRQRGRRPSLKKEEEDAAVAIPLGSEKKTCQRELNDPEGKEDTAGTLVGAEAELAEQSTHNGAQEVPKASAGRYRTRRSSSSSTTTTSSPTTPAPPPQSSSPPPSSSSTKEPHYRYTCGTCGRTFTRSSDVRRHQLTHTGERPFRCSHCAKTFQHAWDLSKHQRKYHGDGECLFRCGTCGADFPNLRQLAIHHKRSHTGVPLPHTCSICGKSFPAAAALGEHRRSHGDKPQYECPQCGQAFDTLLERSKHRQTHVAKRQFKCPQCDKTYTRRADVKRHQLTHTGERPHQCAQCGRCFGLRSALNKHQAVHTGARPFKCRQCGKRFTLLSILERHERMHSGERPFLCSQCGKRFLSLGELSKHYKSHTDERPFQCGQCGKRLKSKRALQEHTLSHRGERPYLCSYCGKGFTKPFALTRHHLMHTGERPYPCAHCGRAFLTSAELTLHERTHTGERPYACPECPMKFRSSSELARHKRNHGKEGGGGDQTHVCGICSKAFASMTKLNKHALTHAKEKGIMCVTLPVDADGMHGAASIVEGHSVVLTVTTTTQNSVDM